MVFNILKRLSITGFALVVLGKSLFAGPPDTLWTKIFGGAGAEGGYWVEQTTDGGYILVGYTESYGAGNRDVWLIKTDANGNQVWNKTFGGDSADEGHCVHQTLDGGYIIGGITRSYGAGLNDIWLIKTDSLGDTLWTKTYGGSGDDGTTFGEGRVSVVQTTDGGYIAAGYSRYLGPGFGGIWLIKMDSSGDTLWTRVFGGSSSDLSYSIQQTMDRGYIIIGTTYSYDAGFGDFWLIKTDSLGNELWNKVYGTGAPEDGYSVQQTTDGGYIAVGHTLIMSPDRDMWFLKTDANGDTLWSRIYYPYDSIGQEGYCVRQTIDGGYIISGFYTGMFWLIKTDQTGDTLWTKLFSNIGPARCVQQTTDSGYIVVANSGGNIRLLKFGAEPGIGESKVEGGGIQGKGLEVTPSVVKGSVGIRYSLPETGDIRLRVYDAQGRFIKEIFRGYKDAGLHSLVIDCRALPSGTYFVELRNGKAVSRKMLVIH
jgi:hypothetical protein